MKFEWLTSSDTPELLIVRQLFEEYQTELGIDLCFQGFSEELATLPGKYAPPGGALLLVSENNQPMACGALRQIGEGIAELKRLYVRPAYRGQGIGREITESLLARAKTLGHHTARLDTLRTLTAALKMYDSLGFKFIQAYSNNAATEPDLDIVYLEKTPL